MVLAQQHATVVASTSAAVAAVHFAMTLGATVPGLVGGLRGPGCPGRLRHVRGVRALALRSLRWAVVHDVRHAGWVVVAGRVHVVNLHDGTASMGRSTL